MRHTKWRAPSGVEALAEERRYEITLALSRSCNTTHTTLCTGSARWSNRLHRPWQDFIRDRHLHGGKREAIDAYVS